MKKVNSLKVDLRVSHEDFGIGTITKIDRDNDRVIIDFDCMYEGKHSRIFKLSKVKLTFFDYSNAIKNNPKEETTSEDLNIFENTESEENSIESSFNIIPSNYSVQSSYTTTSKRLMTFLRKKYVKTEGLATIKSYKENESTTGLIIIPNKGVVIFKMIEDLSDATIFLNEQVEAYYSKIYENYNTYYMNRFMQSKSLCEIIDDKYKLLKFPLKVVLLFQNMDLSALSEDVRAKIYNKNTNFYFKNFSSNENNELLSKFELNSKKYRYIDKSMYGNIIERVIPENATLVNVSTKEKFKTIEKNDTNKFVPIDGREREFKALCLDDAQIKIINDTKQGVYLTLANPGTGKSVLLVSKAYRIQSINKNNNVLITCYNKNLADHHLIFSEISGMKTPNLHINTFHKLVKDIVKNVDSDYIRLNPFSENEEVFEQMVLRLSELIDAGKVQCNFKAIFIDEIQLFNPLWIDICYKLVNYDKTTNFYFEMFGDINQDVKSKHSKGQASWQNTENLPSLQGRVKKLEKNYRNTEIISNYLKCMIDEFNQFINKHGIPIDEESTCISSITLRKGKVKPKIFQSSNRDVKKVIHIINELIDKGHADYNDIAIIYPAKGYGKYYKPIEYIERELDLQSIPYGLIYGTAISGNEKRERVFECDGVTLSTIESSLGLDFKFVILCGLHYWDLFYDQKTQKTEKLVMNKLLFVKDMQLHFAEAGKKIYAAASRARDGLFIVDDLNKDSPIKNIIRPSSGKDYFDEY